MAGANVASAVFIFAIVLTLITRFSEVAASRIASATSRGGGSAGSWFV
jgi:hypothetical protein